MACSILILKEREKRRRRVLIEQLKAHEAQEVFEKPALFCNHQPVFLNIGMLDVTYVCTNFSVCVS